MPYNNTNKNTDKEFFAEAARLLGVTIPTAKRYWFDGFYETMVRMTYRDGCCRMPNLGCIITIHEPESYQEQKDPNNPNGEKILYKVPERDRPEFIAHDTFINDINGLAVTKAARKRIRRNQLNANDFKRIKRASALGDYGSMTPARVEKSKEDLMKLLEEKKQEQEEKEQ